MEKVKIEFIDGTVEYADLPDNGYASLSTFYFIDASPSPSEKTDRIQKITFPYACRGLSSITEDNENYIIFRYIRNLTDLHFSPDMRLPDTVYLDKGYEWYKGDRQYISSLTLPHVNVLPCRILDTCDLKIKTIDIPDSVVSSNTGIHISSLTSLTGGRNLRNGISINCGISSLNDIPDFKTETLTKCVFSGCSKLSDVTRLSGLTRTSTDMFCRTAITEIPPNLTSIGSCSFMGCTGLSSVEFNPGLTGIGRNAFKACSSLTNIVLNDNLRYILYGAFSGTGIKTATVPNGVTTFGAGSSYGPSGDDDGPFANCNELTGVYLPNSITTDMPRAVFYNCDNLISVSYPSSWVKLSEYAYLGCKNLPMSAMILPSEGMTTIPYWCYAGCTKLTSIEFPSSLNEIQQDAFSNTDLTHVNLSGIRSVYQSFTNCLSLSSAVIGDSIMISPFSGCSALASISCVGTYVPSTACDGLSSLKCAYVSPTVGHIKSHAFRNCIGLSSVPMTGISAIDTEAFRNSGLKTVELPASLVSIGENVFSGSTLQTVSSRDLSSIPVGAFAGCQNLTSASFDSVMSIGVSAFQDCQNLVSMGTTKPKEVGYGAFRNDIRLTSDMFANIQTVRPYAFENCAGLSCGISISDDLRIGEHAFSGCANIREISAKSYICLCEEFSYWGSRIYEYPNHIGSNTFAGCSSLTSINSSAEIDEIYAHAFDECNSLVSANMRPSTVGDYAFYGCSSLATPDLSEVTCVYDYAFAGCSNIRYVHMPKLHYVPGRWSFSSCGNLKYAVVGGDIYDFADSLGIFESSPVKTLDITRTRIQSSQKQLARSIFGVSDAVIQTRTSVKPNVRFSVYLDSTTRRYVTTDLTKLITDYGTEGVDIRVNGRKTMFKNYEWSQLEEFPLLFDPGENTCELVYTSYAYLKDTCDIAEFTDAICGQDPDLTLESLNLQASDYMSVSNGQGVSPKQSRWFSITLNNGIRIEDDAFTGVRVKISRLDRASYIGKRAFMNGRLYSPIITVNCPVGPMAFFNSNVQYVTVGADTWLGNGVRFFDNGLTDSEIETSINWNNRTEYYPEDPDVNKQFKNGGTFAYSSLRAIKRLDTLSGDVPSACFANTRLDSAKLPGCGIGVMAFGGCRDLVSLRFCGKQDETSISMFAFLSAMCDVKIYDTRLDTVSRIGYSAFESSGINGDIKVYPH